jgi:hypothetical protein
VGKPIRRAGSVIGLALRPLPFGYDLAQTLGLIVITLGGTSLLAAFWKELPAALFACLVVIVLLFWAAFRLRSTLDALEERKPLEAIAIDVDQGFHRLIVRNPNSFDVKSAFAQVEATGRSGSNADNKPLPPQGYRFPWSSQLTGHGSTTFDLNAQIEAPVDIAVVSGDGFSFIHLSGEATKPMKAQYPQSAGRFSVSILLQAENIPARHIHLEIVNPPLHMAIKG